MGHCAICDSLVGIDKHDPTITPRYQSGMKTSGPEACRLRRPLHCFQGQF